MHNVLKNQSCIDKFAFSWVLSDYEWTVWKGKTRSFFHLISSYHSIAVLKMSLKSNLLFPLVCKICSLVLWLEFIGWWLPTYAGVAWRGIERLHDINVFASQMHSLSKCIQHLHSQLVFSDKVWVMLELERYVYTIWLKIL